MLISSIEKEPIVSAGIFAKAGTVTSGEREAM